MKNPMVFFSVGNFRMHMHTHFHNKLTKITLFIQISGIKCAKSLDVGANTIRYRVSALGGGGPPQPQQPPFFFYWPWSLLAGLTVLDDLPASAKEALNVLPGLMPMFSVRRSYDPALILSLMQAALSIKTCSTPCPVFALVSK